MLDSIVRTKNYSSSGEGMLPGTVPCDVNVNTNLSLAGLRIGLPSNFGELAAESAKGSVVCSHQI